MENWNKRVKRTCVGVLLLAILLRLGGSGPVAGRPFLSLPWRKQPALVLLPGAAAQYGCSVTLPRSSEFRWRL